jgi:DNA-binding transcriptional ArsR family regulator
VLSLFNDVSELTYKEISEKSGIPKRKLDAALIALCNPKIQVLKKQIKKPSFESETELVTLNFEFKSSQVRLSLIPVATAKTRDPAE